MKLTLFAAALSAIYATGTLAIPTAQASTDGPAVQVTYQSDDFSTELNQTVPADESVNPVAAKFAVRAIILGGFGSCTFRGEEGFVDTFTIQGVDREAFPVDPPQVLSSVRCGGPFRSA